MGTMGWSGLYWARKTQAATTRSAPSAEGEAYSYPGGVFPEAFERLYERVDPIVSNPRRRRTGGDSVA